jgi:hypothetical protein
MFGHWKGAIRAAFGQVPLLTTPCIILTVRRISLNLSCHPLSTSFDNYFMLIAVDRGEEFGSHAAIGTNATWRSIF